MNELHTMPLKVEKFFSSANVRMMKWDERGAYLILLAESWLIGGRLPSDREAIRRLLQVESDSDWERIEKNVLTMFKPIESGKFLQNETLADLHKETLHRAKKMSESGKKGNEIRWRSGGESGGESGGDRNQSHNQSHNHNQSQTDINITDLEEKRIVPTSAEHSSKPATIPHWKRIYFDFDAQEWKGITTEDQENWRITYPACDIGGELDKMHMWLVSNPGRKKKNYAAFINNWLCRQQDRGGTK